jgi:hypothetical protein
LSDVHAAIRVCPEVGHSAFSAPQTPALKILAFLPHPTRMATVTEFPVRSTERAICELCGGIIVTKNGGLYTGLRFVPFERLLDLHMAERHPNLCVLPAARERKIAA